MTTGKLQIIEPLTFTVGAGQENLTTNDPKQVVVLAAGGGSVSLDFGAAVTLDSVFVGFTNGAPGAVELYSNTGAGGAGSVLRVASTLVRAADAKSVRSSILLRIAPLASRYWTLLASNATAANMTIGRLAAGLAFEASWDREWGSGRRPIDTAKVQALLGGGFGVQPGARKAAYSWTFGDLTDAEVEQLWGIVYRVGQSSPLIVNEQDGSTTGANEKLHYGLFQRFEAFERRDPNATKWSLEIEEWI